MNPQFDINKINEYNPSDKLKFKCELCETLFYVKAKDVKSNLKRNMPVQKYCSVNCMGNARYKPRLSTLCGQCLKPVNRELRYVKKSKSGKFFCNHSCATKYNNTHKITGTRRSKLEVWLEEKLKTEYPNLTFLFNNKDIINSELDIYIKELKLAIELNGIFHYEPIYGKEKLASIQNNDNRKQQACNELGIELLIIDTSYLINFSEKRAIKYWEIIKNIINLAVLASIDPAFIP